MTVYLDLRGCFDLFCIVQGFTTAAVLFWRREAPQNRWLAWLMVGLTLQVVDYFLSRSGVYFRHQWLYFMPLFYSWSFGPLLYGYVRARAGQPVRLPWWCFLPVLVQALFYLIVTVQSLETKSLFWQVVHKPYTRYVEHYVAAALVLYALYRARPFATDRWLRYLLAGLGTFYIIATIDPLINHLYTPPRWPKFYLTAQLLPVFVYALALIGLLYNKLQKPNRTPALPAIMPVQRDRLVAAMQQDERYKDPDLTLTSLAQHLGETPNTVSRIINAGFNQSFNDFVNTYRIEEVKRRMAAGDTEQFTLLALALDAGFASKTTFNRVFKEQTGQTPQQYLKKELGFT